MAATLLIHDNTVSSQVKGRVSFSGGGGGGEAGAEREPWDIPPKYQFPPPLKYT